MIMKIWSTDVKSNCPQERQSIDEFLMEERDAIDENDTLLNVASYFNVDHEMDWWMWMLMKFCYSFCGLDLPLHGFLKF